LQPPPAADRHHRGRHRDLRRLLGHCL
jgi:hypothetical protein